MADLSPSLCFYGDDFTGSTDALDALTTANVSAALLLEPTDEAMRLLPDVQAVGLAGMSRAMSPDDMEAHLADAFRFLADLNPRVLHYKVCSTFDSSPTKGSIGKAMEIGRRFFGDRATPIVVGAPALGRYVAFGHLFARAGHAPTVHRLDRHPVMSRHPVTPMTESDLRRHLACQTKLPIDLVSLADLEAGHYPALEANGRAVLFDTTSPGHLADIGGWLDRESAEAPIFCVGSSAVETALAPRIGAGGTFRSPPRLAQGPCPVAVVSGSCSPVTAQQMDAAARNGFALIRIEPAELMEDRSMMAACHKAADTATTVLQTGQSVLVYSARGQADFGVAVDERQRGDLERRIGMALGKVLATLVERAALRKVIVAGGDTSGRVARALDLVVLQVVHPLAPGAPLCQGSRRDGSRIEIALKGGQMGGEDFFARARDA